jgi:23S rRNA pseudouridine1911/1915/1917 synthase
VQAGDVIVCRILKLPPIEATPEAIPLDIIHEDEHLIIVNKPAGMVVHPAYGNRSGTLVNALLYHVGAGSIAVEEEEEDDELDDELEDDGIGLSTLHAVPESEGDPSIRPGIVHRLDKDTSGLLVVAKNDHIHRELAKQFADHTIQRRYVAIIWGHPDPPEGKIETDLGRDPRNRKKMAVLPRGQGKHAVTYYEVIELFEHTSLAAFRLETGRTHQIRVHAAHLRHPVLGDATYGGESIRYGHVSANRRAYFRNLFAGLQRQALHAETLGFDHPGTGEKVSFRSDPPEDMRAAIEKLRGGGG